MVLFDAHTHVPYNSSNTIGIVSVDANISVPDFCNNTLYSVGLHPQSLPDNFQTSNSNLERLFSHSSVVAIGECGLDVRFSQTYQETAFRFQATLAQELQLPVIIHCVRSYNEILSLRRELQPSVPWVIHGFNKSPELALQLVRAGFLLSIGKAVLQQHYVKKVVDVLPISSFLIETDNTALNSSEASDELERIYTECAIVKKINILDLTEIITNLFSTVFQKVQL